MGNRITDAKGALFAQHGDHQQPGLIQFAAIVRQDGGAAKMVGRVEARLSLRRAEQTARYRVSCPPMLTPAPVVTGEI